MAESNGGTPVGPVVRVLVMLGASVGTIVVCGVWFGQLTGKFDNFAWRLGDVESAIKARAQQDRETDKALTDLQYKLQRLEDRCCTSVPPLRQLLR